MATTSPLLALTRANPVLARAMVLSALVEHRGNRAHAALALHVHKSLLLRCVELLGLRDEIATRWPERVAGGGAQSAEHREKIAGLAKKRWAKPLETSGFEEK
jgi:hypothetical protein